MVVTKEDIKKLGELARIEISESEAEKMTPEIDSILEFVGKIKGAIGDLQKNVSNHHNIMRDDEVTNSPKQYTDDLLDNAPAKEGGYLKVKKIL